MVTLWSAKPPCAGSIPAYASDSLNLLVCLFRYTYMQVYAPVCSFLWYNIVMFIEKKKRWTKKQLVKAVRESSSFRQVIKTLGLIPAGGNYDQVKKYIDLYNLDIGHFKGRSWNKGMRGIGKPLISLNDILVNNSNYQSYKLKNRLFKDGLKKAECEMCGWCKTSPDGRIPLELDHINGDGRDNRLNNLRILCPNCHSLQPTHRGLNQNRKKRKNA